MPMGTTRSPRARQDGDTSPSFGSTPRSPSSESKVSLTSRGGSQIWCAGVPCPAIRATAMSIVTISAYSASWGRDG